MNAVIYARYSSYSQNEQSIEGQLKECYEYAKKNNYTVINEYIDRAISGKTDNRPQFLKMIEDSNKKTFNIIIVYQLDRFARSRYDSAIYKNKLKKNNVRVVSAKENISNDANGIILESLLEGMAEYYSVELSQKVTRGMKINAEKGLFNGGIIPIGFKINKEKRYEIDEEKAPYIRKAFDMYANGYLVADIIEYFEKNNIKTYFGKKFNKSSIRILLLNEKYAGVYKYNDKIIPNAIPPIIDEDTFEKVQRRMEINKKSPARAKAKIEYILTTKLFCGNCKEMMVGLSGTSRTKKTYYYYSCNGIRKRICKKKNVQKDYIEDLIVNEARKVLTDDNINKIANSVIEILEKEKNNVRLKEIEKALRENEKQKKNVLSSLRLTDDDNIRKVILEEISNIEKEYNELQIQLNEEKNNNFTVTKEQIIFFLNGLKNGDINNLRYRKLLVNVFINKIYLYDDHLTILFNSQKENCTINVPTIEEIESSFMGENAPPNYTYTNIVCFAGMFAIKVKI